MEGQTVTAIALALGMSERTVRRIQADLGIASVVSDAATPPLSRPRQRHDHPPPHSHCDRCGTGCDVDQLSDDGLGMVCPTCIEGARAL